MTRDDIIAVAARVFRRNGYGAATLADIAAELGIQKPSLYHHIRSKQELLIAVLEHGVDRMLTYAERMRADPTLGPCECTKAIVREHVRDAATRGDHVAVFVADFAEVTDRRIRARYVAARDAYENHMRAVIRECLEANGRTDDPRLVAFAVLGLCNSVTAWYSPSGRVAPDQLADQYARLVMGMLGAGA